MAIRKMTLPTRFREIMKMFRRQGTFTEDPVLPFDKIMGSKRDESRTYFNFIITAGGWSKRHQQIVLYMLPNRRWELEEQVDRKIAGSCKANNVVIAGTDAQQCVLDETDLSSHTTLVICVIFILGFVGNAIALWIFLFHLKHWKPNTVYFLNLAIADMLLIICIPFRISYMVHENKWINGDVLCRLNLLLISFNRTSSIFFLVVTAIDRYLKVIHRLRKRNTVPARCAVKIAVALWFMAVAIWLHLVTGRHDFKHNNVTLCESFKINSPQNGTSIWISSVYMLFFFIFTALVILFCVSCITLKMVTTVAAILIICFMPTNIGFVVVVITKLRSARQCNSFNTARHFFYNTLFLTYLNCMINPVVYYFLNLSFNNALMKALLRLKLKSGRPVTSQETEQEGSMDGQTAARQTISETPL
ncbi:hydroxycarboxylic acid receptor 2-like [Amblyraja radiata]|uniref:hydroxycarboxylic acid receptor 2-like n=1 Tax=Amblyraja radiata TaxID=386614 RepID=UPI0014030A58|nr:hydroxycarboxylic acid receptor 2-like [Amblyraja radiata]